MTQLVRSPEFTGSARESREPLDVSWLGEVDYAPTFDKQHELADGRATGTVERDQLLLLEHPSVYTAGRRTTAEERPTDGAPVIDADRGGKITWHGPGQLVGYPIVKLASPIDVVAYVRRLEAALMAVCSDLGLPTQRVEGRSGVWVGTDRKIAAIGVRVAKGVALHGFALNCNPDLRAYDAIIPCGIADAGVTSLTRELGRDVTVDEVRERMAIAVAAELDGRVA